MKLLITGGFGLMGSRLLEIWGAKYEVTVLDTTDETAKFPSVSYQNVDITKKEAVKQAIVNAKPDWVLHLAAFTDVEKAEVERELAWNLNVNATVFIGEAVKEVGCRMVYFSTGFVFEGTKEDGYRESDPENPVNYYSLTKLEGERALEKLHLPLCVLRPNFPYRPKWEKKGDTVRWMIPKLQNGEEITLVTDQFISPTFIDDLALILDKVFAQNITGTYHATPNECLSFFEIGQMVAKAVDADVNLVKPTTLDELLLKLGRKAAQPRRSCLISNKVEQELGIKMTPFSEGIKKVMESFVGAKLVSHGSSK